MARQVIGEIGTRLSDVSRRVMPDPFVLALGLTIVVMALGLTAVIVNDGASVGRASWIVADGWLAGFASKGGLAFALQMSLVLVTGHALALTPSVQRVVAGLATIPKSSAAAAALVALTACISAIIHWGLGAIVGAFLAREIARAAAEEGRTFHYPLLGAAAYAGLAVWHGGLSGSAPLAVAEDGHFLADAMGTVPMEETVFSGLNLAVTGLLTVIIVGLFWLMAPREGSEVPMPELARLSGPAAQTPPPSDEDADVEDADDAEPVGLIDRLQGSFVPGAVIGAFGVLFMVAGFATDRIDLSLTTVILTFLFLGILLQGSLKAYVDAISDGARGVGPIVLQFPFYFALLGIMKAAGLIDIASDTLASVASQTTFPVFAFLAAGLVNFFVPSGGGQWAVQGEILAQTGSSLGVGHDVTVMAFAYGDAWTNMLQPFWALPLLGIMGLRARDIMGYAALVFIVMGTVVPILLLALA